MNLFLKFCPDDALLLLAANVLVQIAVVVCLACAVSLVFARHRAAARHAIWLSALGCVLLSPAAAYLADRAQWPLVSLRLLPQSNASDVDAIPSPVSLAANARRSPDVSQTRLPSLSGKGAAGEGSTEFGIRDSGFRNSQSPNFQISKSPNPTPQAPIPNALVASPHPNPLPKGEGTVICPKGEATAVADLWRAMVGLGVVLWAAGALALFVRLLHGCRSIARMRRRLQPIGSDRLAILADVCRALNAKALPPLAILPQTTALAGPITIGLFRPLVVLPEKLLETLEPDGLRDVLVHEFAHALRRDPLVGFVQRLAAIVYWPYPLVHFLNRRLAWAREEVCDNYVLRQGDAPSYVETLLAISQTFFSKPSRPIALGLFHPYGKLEQRVAELLDPRRNVMVRMHRVALAVLTVMFSAAVVVVAGTRLLHAEPAALPAAPAERTPSGERPVANKPVKQYSDVATIDCLALAEREGTFQASAAYMIRPVSGADATMTKVAISFACEKTSPGAKSFHVVAQDRQGKIYEPVAESGAMSQGAKAPVIMIMAEYSLPRSNIARLIVQQLRESDSQSKPGTPATSKPSIQRRVVNKLVRDFPEKTDLSTPESALVACHRAEAAKDAKAVAKLSWLARSRRELDELPYMLKQLAAAREYDGRNLFEAEVVEVVTYRDDLAGVVVHFKSSKGVDNDFRGCRYFGRINGQWKNLSEGGLITGGGDSDYFEKNKDQLWQFFTEVRDDVIAGRTSPVFRVAAPGGYYVFGPVIERTIHSMDEKHGRFLDLETGKLVAAPHPESLNKLSMREQAAWQKKWAAENGADLWSWEDFLLGMELAAFPMPGISDLDEVGSPHDLRFVDCVEKATPAMLRAGKELPATFCFKTREGTKGVLQIVGFEQSKNAPPRRLSIKIRYKLLEVHPTVQASASGRPPDASLNTIQPLDVLTIRAVGTVRGQPIDGFYLVEPDGKVALGPGYGRVNVNGLTWEQAEKGIVQHLKTILTSPEVQVSLARRGVGPWREAVLPKTPYKIGVFDVLSVCVVGTLPDQPIDGFFLVESTGTVALGPVYGRVQVKGLTPEEAERAIQKKLAEVLSKPEVQVTLSLQKDQKVQWRETEPPKTPYTISPGTLLSLDVVGTITDLPIHGTYTVEPTGSVALGPAYGRAQVIGLTLEAAETAIQNKLKEILRNPRVQVTFAGWRDDAGSPVPGKAKDGLEQGKFGLE
jgi:beta-lactamase regulating signal transducer with metallopeptidase domain/protein involved in polysaccharide export with SLBB domain